MPTLQSFVEFFSRERPEWMRSPSALNMPERFNRDSRMVSFVAHEQALSGGQNAVDIGHLLLALSDDRSVRQALLSAGVDIQRLRSVITTRQTRDLVSHARDGVLPRSNILHLAWQKAHDIADEECSLHISPAQLLVASLLALQTVGDESVLNVLLPMISTQ